MTTQVSGTPMALGEAGITAVMGYVIVFFGIILLIVVVMIMTKLMHRKSSAPQVHAAPAAPAKQIAPAPGAAGELKLYDTDPKTAAMVMAIVADKLQKPLNELRFKSIKEVK